MKTHITLMMMSFYRRILMVYPLRNLKQIHLFLVLCKPTFWSLKSVCPERSLCTKCPCVTSRVIFGFTLFCHAHSTTLPRRIGTIFPLSTHCISVAPSSTG